MKKVMYFCIAFKHFCDTDSNIFFSCVTVTPGCTSAVLLRNTHLRILSHIRAHTGSKMFTIITLMWDIPIVCCKHKYNVSNSQNTTKFIAAAGIQI